MGILKWMLGVDDKGRPRDGQWLETERNTIWWPISSLSNGRRMEFSPVSCYQNSGATFVVMRLCHANNMAYTFFGAMIPKNQGENIVIVVDRTEKANGSVISGDDWEEMRVFGPDLVPDVEGAIYKIRTQAAEANYQNMPPYVFALMLGERGLGT